MMALTFQIFTNNTILPTGVPNLVCLQADNWDDFGFKTLFTVTIFDENAKRHDLGSLKIGYLKQDEGWTLTELPERFQRLDDKFFSLGQDYEYYKKIYDDITPELGQRYLNSINDVVHDMSYLDKAEDDSKILNASSRPSVLYSSLLRNMSKTVIKNQFRRIIEGGSPLTEYRFIYEKPRSNQYTGIKVEFEVNPDQKPSSNIHVFIGRNGVGKTTLLNNMVSALLSNDNSNDIGKFTMRGKWGEELPLPKGYFSGAVSVSFSAFDPFEPPAPQKNREEGICYQYVGLKTKNQPSYNGQDRLKTAHELCNELVESLKVCLSLSSKRRRWLESVKILESDINFAHMNLCELPKIAIEDETENKKKLEVAAFSIFSRLSSGHAIVLLTLTKLIETVEEKTLVIIDEPESHLHPPLLSAFTRTLSKLLLDRNGVAIIATHSPVVLQEVPKNSVLILRRSKLTLSLERPEKETFGENVGTLTREVFRLEVSNSGFRNLLKESVESLDEVTGKPKTYNQILGEYNFQLGDEARVILKGMVFRRDNGVGKES